MASLRREAMYLGLVEALQRCLLACCLAVPRMELEECRVNKVEGADQAGIHLA